VRLTEEQERALAAELLATTHQPDDSGLCPTCRIEPCRVRVMYDQIVTGINTGQTRASGRRRNFILPLGRRRRPTPEP
jgi:hypothetical protein